MELKRLSVITVTYNDPEGLQATCDSLLMLQETLKGVGWEWEHLIVDSSPERNARILDELKAREWPLRYFSQEPRGIYAAMNLGISEATGDWFYLLNSGDRLLDSSALARILARLDGEPEVDLAIAGVERWRNGRLLYPVPPPKSFQRGLLGFNQICHQGMIYRKDSFHRMGDFRTDLKLASDYEHHLRYYLARAKVLLLPEVLAAFDSSGASANQWREAVAEFRKVGNEILPRLTLRERLEYRVRFEKDLLTISLIKWVAGSGLRSRLQPLWLWWKRS